MKIENAVHHSFLPSVTSATATSVDSFLKQFGKKSRQTSDQNLIQAGGHKSGHLVIDSSSSKGGRSQSDTVKAGEQVNQNEIKHNKIDKSSGQNVRIRPYPCSSSFTSLKLLSCDPDFRGDVHPRDDLTLKLSEASSRSCGHRRPASGPEEATSPRSVYSCKDRMNRLVASSSTNRASTGQYNSEKIRLWFT